MADLSSVVERLRPLRPPPDGTAEILAMALVGCLAGAATCVALLRLSARRLPLRRAALAALAASRALPAPERLAAQARMLRDLAGALDRGALSLRGEAWLARLDAIFSTRLFSDGPGRAFGEALYQPRNDIPAEALDGELERLLMRLRK
ncbi:DUF4381 family protein [Methylocystis sp. JAN1]|uniref:DUF4381 family protein n=1 Tax=Methylocystis sp. JAN1 TaxID=3397211 RepID=UPI003FA2EF55